MFGHRPQQIFRAPVSKVKSNDPANREEYIEDVLERYKTDVILLNFVTLQQYCTSQRQGVDVHEEIVYLHKELAEMMHKIRSEVDTKMSTPWSPRYSPSRSDWLLAQYSKNQDGCAYK